MHAAWVADMMKELLERDTQKILQIQLFVLGNYLSSTTKQGDVTTIGKRITMTYCGGVPWYTHPSPPQNKAMNAENLIRSKIEDRKGYTVVSCKSTDLLLDSC